MVYDINSEAFPIILTKYPILDNETSLFLTLEKRNMNLYEGDSEYKNQYILNDYVLSNISLFLNFLKRISIEQDILYVDVFEKRDNYTEQFLNYREEKIINVNKDIHIIKYKLEYKISFNFDIVFCLKNID
ncbi:MAG: hypothetical protein ACI35W_01020 [Anaeroplasmataceae bacterium]